MTSKNEMTDMQALWQSESVKIDMEMMQHAKDSLVGGRVLGRRLWNSFLIALGLLSFVYAGLEWTGVIRSQGWITGTLFVYWLFLIARTRQLRRRIPTIASLTPVDLLKNAIQRAKSNLMLARIMYLVVPLGAVIGGMIGALSSGQIFNNDRISAIPDIAAVAIAVICVTGVLACIAFGLYFARTINMELMQLRERLKEYESEM